VFGILLTGIDRLHGTEYPKAPEECLQFLYGSERCISLEDDLSARE
jgi:hypothetical protein